MKILNVPHAVTRELLVFVRDTKPTASEITAWLSAKKTESAFHILRKEGLLVECDGRFCWHSNHLSSDGLRFKWNQMIWHLDEDLVDWVLERPRKRGIAGGPNEGSDR